MVVLCAALDPPGVSWNRGSQTLPPDLTGAATHQAPGELTLHPERSPPSRVISGDEKQG